jgi:hypothetical protein
MRLGKCLCCEIYKAGRPKRYYFRMVRWLLRQNAIDVLFVVIATAVLLLFVSTLT